MNTNRALLAATIATLAVVATVGAVTLMSSRTAVAAAPAAPEPKTWRARIPDKFTLAYAACVVIAAGLICYLVFFLVPSVQQTIHPTWQLPFQVAGPGLR